MLALHHSSKAPFERSSDILFFFSSLTQMHMSTRWSHRIPRPLSIRISCMHTQAHNSTYFSHHRAKAPIHLDIFHAHTQTHKSTHCSHHNPRPLSVWISSFHTHRSTHISYHNPRPLSIWIPPFTHVSRGCCTTWSFSSYRMLRCLERQM